MTELEKLQVDIEHCGRCPLRYECTNPVPGLGTKDAKYFLIGESPGKSEDCAGIPFVGAAGRRLDKLLVLAGININECYITNLVKCRPPKNRTPKKAERLACYPWLKTELSIVKPQVIILLGAFPTAMFSEEGIRQLHGTMSSVHFTEYDDGTLEIRNGS